jgi:VWFA-related protein
MTKSINCEGSSMRDPVAAFRWSVPSHRSALAAWLVAAAAALGPYAPRPAAGQAIPPADAPAQSIPPASEQVEVVVVNVELWVTDREGVPMRGLTAGDFEVLEDGVPVPISHFAEIRTPSSAGPGPGSRRQPMESPATAAAPPAAVEEPGHLVIYFDQLHLPALSTKRLTGDLVQLLRSGRVPPERVLVLRQGFDLFTEAALGSTRQEIEAALGRIAEGASLGQTDPRSALARLQRAWDEARERPDPCRLFSIAAKGEISSHMGQVERAAAFTLESLRKTAHLLAGLAGPKTMIFVSDALETRPGAELVRFAQNACGGEPELSALAQQGDATHLSRQLLAFAEEANRNRITVYPFQASGLRTPTTMGPEQTTFEPWTDSGVDALMRAARRDGLVELAKQTGGWAVVDRNRFAGDLRRLVDDMTSYYSLAYTPPRAGGSGAHTIEVRAKGELARHARLRHRLGYRGREVADPLQEGLESAIAFGVQRNPLGVRIAAGVLGAADTGRYPLPLHVLVPAARLAFLPLASGEQARIKVLVHARNARSKEVVKVEKLLEAGRPGTGIELLDLRLALELPQGIHVVAVAVRDELSRETSVVATTVAIHDPGAKTSTAGS